MQQKSRKPLTKLILVSLGIPTVFFPGLILAAILGWDWQKDLDRLAKSGGYKQYETMFPSEAVATEVLDGDTFMINNGQTVRMIGIDAPNRGEDGYSEAREYLTDLIEGEKIYLEYDYYQDDKFGRILAYAWEGCRTSIGCKEGKRMINWVMVKKDLAKVVTYEDRRKIKYEELLEEAEK